MKLMNKYLSANNKFKPDAIVIKNILIIFTTSYGVKLLLLTCKRNEESHSTENTKKTADLAPPKKRKIYTVAMYRQLPFRI